MKIAENNCNNILVYKPSLEFMYLTRYSIGHRTPH